MKQNFSMGFRYAAITGALALGLLSQGCKKAVDDASLTANVQQKLSSDTALVNEPVQVAAQNGVVTLNGEVSNTTARALAANDASSVPGVKEVINNLAVTPATQAAAPAPEALPAPVPVPIAPVKKVEPKAKKPAPAPVERMAPPAPVVAQKPTPAPAPAPPPAPKFQDVTLPAGSTIPVRLTQALASNTNQTGDSFSGVVAADVMQDGLVVLSRGATVTGTVVDAKDATHFKGNSSISIALNGVTRHGDHLALPTEAITEEGKGRGKNTAEKAGIGAAAGAILGGIFGGGKGAAIGAAAGGGTGLGINAVTKGQQVSIPSESILRFHTKAPLTVRVPLNPSPSQQ